KTISPEAPKVTVSIVSLAAAIVLLTAPETKDLPMPEDVNDFDPGRFLQLFGYQKQRKQSVFMAAENAAIFEEWTTMERERRRLRALKKEHRKKELEEAKEDEKRKWLSFNAKAASRSMKVFF
ncbi:unnamed protein product, partial [Acanthocheilonema viteae]